jgi:prophage antirepressor-like protein
MTTQKEVFEQINALDHVIDDKGVWWFYAKQLCDYLEYKKAVQHILKSHVDDNNKCKYNKIILTGPIKAGENVYNHRHTFINADGLYQLIDKSTKENAKKFKKYVVQCMEDLRLKGYVDDKSHEGRINIHENIYHFTRKKMTDDKESRFYDNEDEEMDLFSELNKDIDLSQYDMQSCIYLFVTSIKNMKDDRLILKIGFTQDIISRCKSIHDEYGSTFKLIAINLVNNINDEKKLHRRLKNCDNGIYWYPVKIGKTDKTELYYCDDEHKIICLFLDYNVKLTHNIVTQLEFDNNKVLLELQKEKNREIELKIEYHKLINCIK